MMKQKVTHANKDIKKAKPTVTPKTIKPTDGVSKRAGVGGPKLKKGKSL
ncbi:hypothetical protein [Glaciimonas immobilis]|uniref:Uncharacterized protein n=1 Tax=Glaciimonas immobilis TaxID=728004 RepID=A0A840RSJ6_9BURK|nr:hypothetical protein [Glaciimonas immobilis]KAF3997539.1 hypothetical protein HAV38_12740 [Glaciimonas immobilis]MBB5200775.1 hypothetical protein [Glaciimonas immobilis]